MSKKENTKGTSAATGAAERTLSTLSDGLDNVGEAARDTGMAVRDRFRDSARALERGGRVLSTSGVGGAAAALALAVRRRKRALLGAAGAMAGGLLAFGVARRVMRNRSSSD